MKKIILISITLLFAVACGSNNKNSNARVKNISVSDDAKMALADKSSEEKVICKQQRRMGSNRITTVCRSESELKAVRESTQRELRRGPQSGASGTGTGGR